MGRSIARQGKAYARFGVAYLSSGKGPDGLCQCIQDETTLECTRKPRNNPYITANRFGVCTCISSV